MQPGAEPGDVVFILNQLEDDRFKRREDDLYMTYKITLTEAIAGFAFSLTHLDGRQLLIKSERNVVVKPGMLSFQFLSFLSLTSCPLLLETN
jgi:DnaJ family protein A protein 2